MALGNVLRSAMVGRHRPLDVSIRLEAFVRQHLDRFERCEACIDGHDPGCDILKAEDLGDCLAFACRGCCPVGCTADGLAREATHAGYHLRKMLGET